MTDSTHRFNHLTFADFKLMAKDPTLSCYEKIGFPDHYREPHEANIFQDILGKLSQLQQREKVVVDIGPGCSQLPHQLIELCKQQNHQLILIDSEEMLAHLPDDNCITKIPARFPNECLRFLENYAEKIDVILSYSVLQYVFIEGNIFAFIDSAVKLLAPQGQFLLADIPNISKRKRLFSTETGRKYHQQHFSALPFPEVKHFQIEPQQIDDAVIFAILMRARQSGFDSYILPQAEHLPFANRREDILIIRP